ncbi:Imm30 family immunity protein [Microcoleus sp. LAD1_D3]|uniref:Imm30 family immunity protein n=1 Tax=Microcoleus sp. LAD1_D3 TaxID=2819365 RepID=UPI002FD276C0
MSHNSLINVLETNRLMRSDEEVAAFENALAELAKNSPIENLRELHLVLDDKCQHPEVMFSLIHFLESFDVKKQLQAFIKAVPQLIVSAPEWTKIIHDRILNDESARACYQDILSAVDSQSSLMKQTIELPKELADLLEQYLKEIPPNQLIVYLREQLGLVKPEFQGLSDLLAVAGVAKDK